MSKKEQIQKELEKVKGDKDLLHPAAVVEWAKKHKDSALHGCFQWDDTEAAKQYRIWQARTLISLHIVTVEGERRSVSLSIDRSRGGGYRRTEDVLRSPELSRVMLEDALQELRRVREKYNSLKELARVFAEIDAVEQEHSKAA